MNELTDGEWTMLLSRWFHSTTLLHSLLATVGGREKCERLTCDEYGLFGESTLSDAGKCWQVLVAVITIHLGDSDW